MSYEMTQRRRKGMGIEINGQGAGFDPSHIWGFYLLPGVIGLLGLWVVARVFGPKGA